MSKLDELLQGVDVEWLPLGDVAEYVRGLTYNKTNESKVNTGYKVLRANNITLSNNSLNFDDIKYINFNTKVKDNQKLYKYDILISAASGSRDHVGKVAYIDSDLDYYFGGFMGVVRCSSKIISKYLFYILTSDIFKRYIDNALNTATINNLSSSVMNAFKFPIPCPDNPEKSLEIQQEIVRVLDELTSLTNQLTTELETERQNRKKQFEFFREQLFRFKEGEFKWVILGDNEYFKISSGGTPSKNKNEYWNKGNIPWLRSESCNNKSIIKAKEFISELGLKNSSAKLLEPNTTLIALVGATIFKTGFLKFNACTNQNIASIKSINLNLVNDEYVFMYITSLYETLKAQMKNYGMLNLTTLRGFKIPIPPLAEQERIVKLLDQFDATHTAIEEEISKEIKLRTQQYEYYREKLLSFPSLRTT